MIYEYNDYKKYIEHRFEQMPKRGRGQARQLALHLNVQPVVVSQILSGDRDFTLEQSLEVTKFLGLDSKQAEYFILLVTYARAGSANLKKHFRDRIDKLQTESQKLRNQVVSHRELDEGEKAVFYSSWVYSAVRLSTSVPGRDTTEAIAQELGLSRSRVGEILDFLLRARLVEEKNGHYSMGVPSTFLDTTSPFLNNHRRNWRLKAIEKISEPGPDELFYSSTCSLSKADFEKLRNDITAFIKKFSRTVADSPAEELACINIDWFKV